MTRHITPMSIGAIAAVWLIYAADVAIGIFDMFGDAFWQSLTTIADWKVYYATFVLLLFPLLSCGAYVLSKPLNSRALGALMIFTFSTVCIYMHSMYFPFARTAAAYAEASGQNKQALRDLLTQFTFIKDIFGAIFMAALLVIFVWIFIRVISGRTEYPRYLAFINPMTGLFISMILRAIAPGLREAIMPVFVSSFWLGLLMTSYLLYWLRLRSSRG